MLSRRMTALPGGVKVALLYAPSSNRCLVMTDLIPTENVTDNGALDRLLVEVRQCQHCHDLPLGANPVLRAHSAARILIVGQAPGTRVHETGIPWNDPSGDRLREWLGVDRATFYDQQRIAIIPMGFCYPGRGRSGDLPPRRECAPRWHSPLLAELPNIELVLLVGQYAQRYYLPPDAIGKTLTATVRQWHRYGPRFLPLVHPSPRNRRWLSQNPWFEQEVVPALRDRVARLVHPQ